MASPVPKMWLLLDQRSTDRSFRYDPNGSRTVFQHFLDQYVIRPGNKGVSPNKKRFIKRSKISASLR